MGLDAWFIASEKEFKTDPKDAGAIVPVDEESSKNTIEIGYFRKFHSLQDYMENLYIEREGQDIFNCKKLLLDETDLKDILVSAIAGTFTEKMFVQHSIYYNSIYYKTELLIIVHSALQLLKDGFTVYYDSWW